MKVYTRLVISLVTGEVVEKESFEYEGEVAEAKKSSGPSQQTVVAQPPAYIAAAQEDVLNKAKNLYSSDTPMTAAINANQQEGLSGLSQAGSNFAQYIGTPGSGGLSDQTFNAIGRYLDPSALDVASNPVYNAAADANSGAIYRNLTQQALPQIRGGFQDAYGGSRQGIAEGLAMQGAAQADADARARMAADLYRMNLGAQTQILGQAPRLAAELGQVGAAPAQMELESGMIQQQLEQNQLLDPFNRLNWLNTFVPTVSGSTTTTTLPQAKQSPLAGAAGGALAGASVGGPWGALIGGGVGLLGSL